MAAGTQKGLHTSNYHGNDGSEDHSAPDWSATSMYLHVELGRCVLQSLHYTWGIGDSAHDDDVGSRKRKLAVIVVDFFPSC